MLESDHAFTRSSADIPISRAILRSSTGEISRAFMHRHRRATAVGMAKLLVRAALANFRKSESLQSSSDFLRLKDRQLAHVD
jgi:hypothetical protein